METKAHLTDELTERERLHRSLAFEAAADGIVLLHNNGCLPLQPCPIALYGAGAEYTIKGGTGSGEVNVRHTVTIREGLERAGFATVTEAWLRRYDQQWRQGKQAFLKAVKRKLWWPSAKVINDMMSAEYRFPSGDRLTEQEVADCGADTCVYVLSRQSGEGHDLQDVPGSFRMDDTEQHNIRLCAARFKRFVLVINTGCPIDLSPLDEMSGIDAVVYMGQLGMEGGNALAPVLTGQRTPCGRLAVSWPARYSDVPFGDEFGRDAVRAEYKEGIYVGYRYYDSFAVAPRYPFGFGLSYTSFDLSPHTPTLTGESVAGFVQVTNSGSNYAGREVVQVYVSLSSDDCEYQRLVAFAKTGTLAPGQTQTVKWAFPLSALAQYDPTAAATVIPAGRHLIRVGTSSRNTQPLAVLRVDRTIVLSRHRHLCAAARQVAELTHPNRFDIPDSLPELTVDDSACTTRVIDYTPQPLNPSPRVQQALSRLLPEDELLLCTGTGMSGENRGFRTPGAVGHTTTAFIERGIPNIELCDGPAGVRLERRAVRYADGQIRAVDMSLSVYELLPRWLLRWFILGDPDKGQMLYQFVTGFPIEAMVAQTWDISLAQRIGQAVSREMNEYGVRVWLAPAMNIVRNPLCGRNYEYYSEDPLLTGLMAAAVTQGVQQAHGTIATLKHFCANNQEKHRFVVSSEVDERVLREIYWRGFELAIRLAQPRAVMTAYNRLNGTYCSNNSELCTDLLRCEWLFDGLVMTDWFATDQGRADNTQALNAGVDLIMPGAKKVTKSLTRAFRQGQLPHDIVHRAATRVLEAVLADE
ncbi:MAG: glycoside hydrolase family 3 C-terminal domain-containing protein [Paludibacteraceae bacterium]|nr:glycoside hydrolase family 3 C-terminal domain-containing protein [Paludibacteraceae bacterium]